MTYYELPKLNIWKMDVESIVTASASAERTDDDAVQKLIDDNNLSQDTPVGDWNG